MGPSPQPSRSSLSQGAGGSDSPSYPSTPHPQPALYLLKPSALLSRQLESAWPPPQVLHSQFVFAVLPGFHKDSLSSLGMPLPFCSCKQAFLSFNHKCLSELTGSLTLPQVLRTQTEKWTETLPSSDPHRTNKQTQALYTEDSERHGPRGLMG